MAVKTVNTISPDIWVWDRPLPHLTSHPPGAEPVQGYTWDRPGYYTRVWIITVPPEVTACYLTIGGGRGGAGAQGDRPLFIHKVCFIQLSTDHTTKAEAKADDRKALANPACSDGHPGGGGPSLHLWLVLQHLRPSFEPKGPRSFCPVETALCLYSRAKSRSRALHLTDPKSTPRQNHCMLLFILAGDPTPQSLAHSTCSINNH